MRTIALAVTLGLTACSAAPTLATPVAEAAAKVGEVAPDFTLVDTTGAKHTLSAQKGKVVVLEWYNPDCPFVKQAHGADGALRTMGDAAAKDPDVVWWAINSGAPGNQGHGKERNATSKGEYGFAYPVLLDESGTVGKAYDAKTTPHMFIVGKDGTLAYAGGLDNAPFGDTKGAELDPYVAKALEAVKAGKAAQPSSTKAYGCSVKY